MGFKITESMVKAYMSVHSGCSEEQARQELAALSDKEKEDLATLGGKPEAYGDYFNPRVTHGSANINGEDYTFEGRAYDTDKFIANNNLFGSNPIEFFRDQVEGWFHIGSKEGSLIEFAANDVDAEVAKKRAVIVDEARTEQAQKIFDKAFSDTDVTTLLLRHYLSDLAKDAPDVDYSKISDDDLKNDILTLKNVVSKFSDEEKNEMARIASRYSVAKSTNNKQGMAEAQKAMEEFFADQKISQKMDLYANDAKNIGKGILAGLTFSNPSVALAATALSVFASCGTFDDTAKVTSSEFNIEGEKMYASVTIKQDMKWEDVIKILEDYKKILEEYRKDASDDNKKLRDLLNAKFNTVISMLGDIIDYQIAHGNKMDVMITKLTELGVQSDKIVDAINTNTNSLNALRILVNTMLGVASSNNKYLKDLTEILKRIEQGMISPEDLDKIVEAINSLKKELQSMKKDIGEKLDIQADTLDKIDKNGVQANALLKNILSLLDRLDYNTQKYFKSLIDQVAENGNKIDDLNTILQTINQNVLNGNKDAKEIGEKVILLLSRLGISVSTGFKNLYNQGKLTLDMLDKILKAIDNLDADMQAKLQAIINNDNVNTAAILELLGKIEKNGKETNVKLGNIEVKLNNMINGIKLILKDLDDLKKQAKDSHTTITRIYNKLIEGIDVDVKVTVDITGKVTCDCTCDKNPCPNEGIITELNDIIG